MLEWSTDWHPGFDGLDRVLRNGSWNDTARYTRCDRVTFDYPDASERFIEFRSALPAEHNHPL